jgi:hypothetical protein
MRVVAVVLAVVALALLAWGAGEAHYQSCVARAEATTPGVTRSLLPNLTPSLQDEGEGRVRAVNGCSRLPF